MALYPKSPAWRRLAEGAIVDTQTRTTFHRPEMRSPLALAPSHFLTSSIPGNTKPAPTTVKALDASALSFRWPAGRRRACGSYHWVRGKRRWDDGGDGGDGGHRGGSWQ
jgi:hypothetical protein